MCEWQEEWRESIEKMNKMYMYLTYTAHVQCPCMYIHSLYMYYTLWLGEVTHEEITHRHCTYKCMCEHIHAQGCVLHELSSSLHIHYTQAQLVHSHRPYTFVHCTCNMYNTWTNVYTMYSADTCTCTCKVHAIPCERMFITYIYRLQTSLFASSTRHQILSCG